jgi:hypothetical protein
MPLWPFTPKSVLDPDDEEWQLETWRWLLGHFGGLDDLRLSPLVTPSRAFFPPTEATGHARAEHIFGLVKQHADMAEWHCQLAAQPRRPQIQVGELAALKFDGGHAAGTFGLDGNEVVITYDPATLDDPAALVATLAHELAHYRLATLPELPPGGAEMVEFTTDLTTVYLGFGLFGANCAFQFQQFQGVLSQGWSSSRQGYLSENEWSFALAVFCALRSEPIEAAKPFLKDHLFTGMRKAAAYLDRNPTLLTPLREATPLPKSSNPS